MNAFGSTGCVIAVVLASTGRAQVTQRVSLSSAGAQGNFGCIGGTTSPDGRYVVFTSYANNLVPGDTNGTWDAFVRDRRQGMTECVSVDSIGRTGNDDSYSGWLSADGRFVTFTSGASNLVLGDTNGTYDAFLRDRITGTTERLSVNAQGVQGNNMMAEGPITPDGRYVLLAGFATNLVPIGNHGAPQVFLRDRTSGTIEPASVDSNGNFGNYESGGPSISDDGRFVAFVSAATSLVVPDASGQDPDVFVHDRQTGVTERASVNSNGGQANGSQGNNGAQISGNGRYVAFMHDATNLVPGDTNDLPDVFVHDRLTGTTERVSVDSGGVQGNGECMIPSITADGRYVSFSSGADNLVPGDTNGEWDIFVHDRQTGTTEQVSVD